MKPHEYVALEVARERERQMAQEGWTPKHDDAHSKGEMARAAACYAWASSLNERHRSVNGEGDATDRRMWHGMIILRRLWPWSLSWWKPKDRRRDLIRAAALIVAEIERLDRAALKGGSDV